MTTRDLPPIHAGEHLQELIDELGITPYRLAKALHVPQTAVGEILKGKRSISLEMACRLGCFFGQTPQFWRNLQAQYEQEMAEASGLTARIAAEVEPLAL